MADKKISDFTAVTTLADGDLFEIETAGGNSRKITKANTAKAMTGWTLVDQAGAPAAGSATWTWSTNVTEVDVVGLAGFNELKILARLITAANSGVRVLSLSTDNGSTFHTVSGDYDTVSTAGLETAGTGIAHSTSSTAARTLFAHILNTKGAVKEIIYTGSAPVLLFDASSSAINALRLNNSAGGNLTGGVLYVYGR